MQPEEMTMDPHEDVVRVERLTLSRNAIRILDDISMRIPQGAVVGLVGRNGAGKSSLLQCLTGLTEPTSGTSTLFGCLSLKLGMGNARGSAMSPRAPTCSNG